ncbi:MAG: hypothetical protein ACREJD_16015 [Phycisphaerales bacterium]
MKTLLRLSAGAATIALCASAFGVPWPLANQGKSHRIWHGYSTFTDLGSLHYHEGCDLAVADGQRPDVLAVEKGKLVEKGGAGDDIFITVERKGNAKEGFGYVHIDMVINLATGAEWKVGDDVTDGDRIGRVRDHAGLMDHLHFEYDNDSAKPGWSATGAIAADLNGDPLDLLSPNTNAAEPVISQTASHFLYRKGEDEGKKAAEYMDVEDKDKNRVLKGNIDIVAEVSNKFTSDDKDNPYNLHARKLTFKVDDAKGGAAIAEQTLTEFKDLFLSKDAPNKDRNTFAKFRQPARAQVIYEVDDTAKSVGNSGGGGGVSSADAKFFYILTNKNDNSDIELDDAKFFWHTKVKQGEAWNNNKSPDDDAENNGKAQFPDGKYVVTVKAFGIGSKTGASVEKTDNVFVLNFPRAVEPEPAPAKPGKELKVTGSEFRANTPYTVIIVPHRTWISGDPIPSGPVVSSAVLVSDSDGKLSGEVWSSYSPNGDPDKGYDIVVDYDEDAIYQEPIDGTPVDALATVSSQGYCPGDLNADTIVDDADFVIFLAAYDILDCNSSDMPAGCPSDLNGDGIVDTADFELFVVPYEEYFCQSVPPE